MIPLPAIFVSRFSVLLVVKIFSEIVDSSEVSSVFALSDLDNCLIIFRTNNSCVSLSKLLNIFLNFFWFATDFELVSFSLVSVLLFLALGVVLLESEFSCEFVFDLKV